MVQEDGFVSRERKALPIADSGSSLKSDCSRCFGLCCMALPFAKSADFAVDKAAGRPCGLLRADFGCTIHSRLRDHGYRGCTVFECFGAGQQVSQVTFGGRDWRQNPKSAQQMVDVFAVMRQLHEMLSHLTEAAGWSAARAVRADLRLVHEEVTRLTAASVEDLLGVDVGELQSRVGPLLSRASKLVRAGRPGRRVDRRGADLIGKRLRGADWRGADLRRSYLIGADLRGADLRAADLLGADLRDTDLCGADLRDSLFLTQPQVNAAKGDTRTRLSEVIDRPAHWRR